jgi:hypothetical protein
MAHGWWSKQGVKCDDKLNATKEIGWSKVDAMGIIVWKGGDV